MTKVLWSERVHIFDNLVDFGIADDLVASERGHDRVWICLRCIPDLGAQLGLVWKSRLHGNQRWSDVAGQFATFNLVTGQAVAFLSIEGEFFVSAMLPDMAATQTAVASRLGVCRIVSSSLRVCEI
jgi:hypothetical protein